LRQESEPSGPYAQSHLRRNDNESIAVPQQSLQLSSDSATLLGQIEHLERALRNHQHQEHELEIRINVLVEENEASQRSYQLANKEARQLNNILRDLSDLVTKTDEATERHQNLPALHSIRMEDAYNANELLLSVKEDWSGRGSHAEFKRGETVPLEKGRVLGYGMNGEVVEVICKGVKIALKKIHHRHRIQIGQMREINVLKELKHHHIVKLVGTYTQRPYLGLLLWPVAQCDLALVLKFMETDGLYNESSAQEPGFLEELAEHSLDIKGLRDIVGVQDERIWSSFGCLTRAMAYLHENNVRHKDIKPSNILLSRDGIWITDFGSAKDFTADLTSTSESRERGTLRYCAPEVSSYEKSGRSADIFSLGCVFLEMAIVLSHNHTLEDVDKLRPLKNQSYEANLDHIDQWLALAEPTETKTQHLLDEIKQMLNHDRARRPTAKALALNISIMDEYNDNQQTKSLHGPCCDLERELKVYKERIEKLEGEQRESQK
jgi:serine/threonine protein kinase